MKIGLRCIALCFLPLFLCFCLLSCGKKEEKTASFFFPEKNFNIRQTHEQSYVLDASGKIRNASPYDVKNVVVTAYCRSCVLNFTGRTWFISEKEKTPNQTDNIGYLPAGAVYDFKFEEVAFYFTHEHQPPDFIPESIEMVVESYEIVER